MPIKADKGYKCKYCGAPKDSPMQAIHCEQSHGIVYIPFWPSDILALVQFIFSKDNSLLSDRLMTTLQHYTSNIRIVEPNEMPNLSSGLDIDFENDDSI